MHRLETWFQEKIQLLDFSRQWRFIIHMGHGPCPGSLYLLYLTWDNKKLCKLFMLQHAHNFKLLIPYLTKGELRTSEMNFYRFLHCLICCWLSEKSFGLYLNISRIICLLQTGFWTVSCMFMMTKRDVCVCIGLLFLGNWIHLWRSGFQKSVNQR